MLLVNRSRSRSSSSSRSASRSSSSEREVCHRRGPSPGDPEPQAAASSEELHKPCDSETVPPMVGVMRKLRIRKKEADVPDSVATNGSAPGSKRRWGTSHYLPNKKPAIVISTDSLKVRTTLL